MKSKNFGKTHNFRAGNSEYQSQVRWTELKRVDARESGRYVQSRDEHEPEPTPT